MPALKLSVVLLWFLKLRIRQQDCFVGLKKLSAALGRDKNGLTGFWFTPPSHLFQPFNPG